jgi:phage baseplate assembly protein V
MNTLRVGIVQIQDATRCRVRVKFPDRDQMQSWWLPVIVLKSQNDKGYYLPDVGEQVVCLMDEYDEDGAVLGAIYSTVDTPPAGMTADKLHWSAKDGAVFEYDRAEHALTIALPSSGATMNITANGASIAIDASSNVKVVAQGQIELGSSTLNITASGASITIDASGNVKAAALGQIELGSSTLKGVARLGDTVTCPAGTGTITSASANVLAD